MRFVPRIPPPPCPFRVHSCFSWLNNLPASSCPLVSIRGSYSFRHFVPFVYFVLFVVHPLLNGRVAELPRGRAHARHPRTTFSSLLPVPYPTEAHCIVSPHCLLLPPPYSLLFFLFGGKVRRDVYIRRPYTCVAGCTVRCHPSTIIEFVPVPNPMRAGFSRHVLDRLRRWLICHTARHGRD